MVKKNAKKNSEKNGGGDGNDVKKQQAPAKPAVVKPAPTSKPTEKTSQASKPVKSSSNSGLWMMILIVSIGYGVGFYYVFEKMKQENNLLSMQFNSLKKEVGSLSKVNSDLSSVTEAVKSIPEIKQSLNSLKSELADSLKDAMEPLRDALAVAETNIEGLSNDIIRISTASQEQIDKMSALQESVSTSQLTTSKVESKLMKSAEFVNSKFTNYEKDARSFEEALSEKISLLEKKTSQQMKDMMLHVTESKQLSESLQTASDELKAGMKYEVSDGLKQIKSEVQENKQALENVLSNLRGLELQLTKLESEENASDLSRLNEELQQIHGEMKALATSRRALEDFSKESRQKLEREISILTSSLRAVKELVSTATDDVTALTSSVTNIKNTVDAEKEKSEKLAAKLEIH